MSPIPQVSMVRCQSYAAELGPALKRVLADIGGLATRIKPGARVLVKPNLLTNRPPQAAVTTHPEFVRAILREIRSHGGEPVVADSPCSVVKLERVWEDSGLLAMCQEENTPLLNLEKAGSETFAWEDCRFSIATPILEADLLINVPKVKTHTLTLLTAAMKNLYGTLPGYQKASLHKQFPTPATFGRFIIELNQRLPAGLHIADGILAMEGNGPSGGRPISLNVIAASDHAGAMDVALCRLLGIKPHNVAYLKNAPLEIDLHGDPLDELRPRSFAIPNSLLPSLIPRPLVRMLAPWVWFRPTFLDTCVRCGLCVKACPVQALALGQTKPVLDKGKCIGCCCCHEVCPEKAVNMIQSPLLNLVRKGKMP